jgi:diadenosine tetraphosphatase ApaH/serine/threonine PP2A family protein phosphatase
MQSSFVSSDPRFDPLFPDHTEPPGQASACNSVFGIAHSVVASFEAHLTQSDPIHSIGRTLPLPTFAALHVRAICEAAADIFRNWPIVLRLSSPISIVGDLHGNIHDLVRILRTVPPDAPVLFLGDYVDRGSFSTEVVVLLFALTIRNPGRYFLLRGNHECVNVTESYGFKAEILSQFDNSVYHAVMSAFVWLPLAAVIDGSIFCVHGGIGPHVKSIKEIEALKRPLANGKVSSIVMELLWSDPSEAIAWFSDPPGNGRPLYGRSAVRSFLAENNLKSILRAHQCVNGVHQVPGMAVATIFSSSAYPNTEPPNQSGMVVVPSPDVLKALTFEPIVPLSREEAKFGRSGRRQSSAQLPRLLVGASRIQNQSGCLLAQRHRMARITEPSILARSFETVSVAGAHVNNPC